MTVVLLLSVVPAAAQTYPTAIDRNSVMLTYWPTGATSAFAVGLSYQFNPQWDALFSYRSGPGTGVSQFTLGGRYHVRPPSPGFDVFATLQYASPSPGTSYLMVGGGLVQPLAPGLKSYMILNYALLPGGALIVPNLGVQYELSRQASLVAGIDLATVATGYLGVTFDISVR